MAFATIHYFSRSLRKASSFNIVFPEDPATPRPWAAFYLLHGLSDDNTIWARRTSIERYVEGLPMAVVMPDGGRGWYYQRDRGRRLRGRPAQGCHRPGRADVPGPGGARRPGHRRALDGRIRGRQARAEASGAVRQREFPLGRPPVPAGGREEIQGVLPRVPADPRQVARPAGPRIRSRSCRTDRPWPRPIAAARLRHR